MKVLTVNHVTQRFGGLTALSDINLEIREHEIVGVIGPNGAGKSTLFNVITGMYAPTEGDVYLGETCISGWKPYEITAAGLGRTFQNIRLFPRMTALENVILGMHCRRQTTLPQIIFSTRRKKSPASAAIPEDSSANRLPTSFSASGSVSLEYRIRAFK